MAIEVLKKGSSVKQLTSHSEHISTTTLLVYSFSMKNNLTCPNPTCKSSKKKLKRKQNREILKNSHSDV